MFSTVVSPNHSNGRDDGNAIAVDSSGNIYVAGSTSSSSFPAVNAFQATCSSCVTTLAPDAYMLKISGVATSAVVAFPPSLALGSQLVGSTSAPQVVTLTNNGTSALTINSITASGDFAQTNTCGTSVAATSYCVINVTFTPTAAGARTGALTISDGDPSSPQSVSLTGTGTVSGTSASVSPPSLTFAYQPVGTASSTQTVTLTNAGNTTLNITSVAVTADYAQTNNCGSSVAGGANCTINVTFTPTAAGSRSGTLTITDNASGSPQTVALTGTGIDFVVTTASGSSSTQTVTAGQTATYTLVLAGTAGFSGTVSLACTGTPAYANCVVAPGSTALSGTTPVSATVKVTTTARAMVAPRGHVRPPAVGGACAVVAYARVAPGGAGHR